MIASGLITLANLFTTFLPQWSLKGVTGDLGQFAFAFLVYVGGQFFGSLVALLGISAYLKSKY